MHSYVSPDVELHKSQMLALLLNVADAQNW